MKYKRETHIGRPSKHTKEYIEFVKQFIKVGEDVIYELILSDSPNGFIRRIMVKGTLLEIDGIHAYILNEGKKYHIQLRDIYPNMPQNTSITD